MRSAASPKKLCFCHQAWRPIMKCCEVYLSVLSSVIRLQTLLGISVLQMSSFTACVVMVVVRGRYNRETTKQAKHNTRGYNINVSRCKLSEVVAVIGARPDGCAAARDQTPGDLVISSGQWLRS